MSRSLPRNARVLALAAAVVVVAINAVVPSASTQLATGPADLATVDAWLDAQRRDAGIPGAAIVVVRDGRVVHTAGFGQADASGRRVTAETPFVLGSVSKSMTALAVAQLAESAQVDLDAPVRTYLPEFTLADPTASAAVTVRQLLVQTSGIPTAAGIAPLQTHATSLAARVRDLATVAPVSPPGSTYHYSNANYLVLGRLIEVVSGKPYAQYLEAHVFGPLGMRHSTADRSTPQAAGLVAAHRLFFGLPGPDLSPLDRPDLAPSGFVSSTAGDLGLFLAALLDPAGAGGGRVGTASTVSALLVGEAPTGVGDERYAMGWADSTMFGERVVAHAGSTTDMASYVALVPARHLAIAVLLNAQSPLYELLHKPELIGTGALAQLLGTEAPGTIENLYPAVDGLFLVIVVVLVVGLMRLVRRTVATARGDLAIATPASVPSRTRRFLSLTIRGYLDVVIPLGVLFTVPTLLGAGWPVLIRTDLGVVFATIGLLRLADGVIRATGKAWTVRTARPGRTAAGLSLG